MDPLEKGYEMESDSPMENSRMGGLTDDMVIPNGEMPYTPVEPGYTGDGYVPEYADGYENSVGEAYGDGFSGVHADGVLSSGAVTLWEEGKPVAGWDEMVVHSKYRATTNGKVYDLLDDGSEKESLWQQARETVDKAGDDIKESLNNIEPPFKK